MSKLTKVTIQNEKVVDVAPAKYEIGSCVPNRDMCHENQSTDAWQVVADGAMSQIELKPCPFCGGTDIDYAHTKVSMNDYVHIYRCDKCCISKGSSISKVIAANRWNSRPIEDKLHAEIDRLERALSYVASVVIELEPLEQYTIDSIREVALYETSGGKE